MGTCNKKINKKKINNTIATGFVPPSMSATVGHHTLSTTSAVSGTPTRSDCKGKYHTRVYVFFRASLDALAAEPPVRLPCCPAQRAHSSKYVFP